MGKLAAGLAVVAASIIGLVAGLIVGSALGERVAREALKERASRLEQIIQEAEKTGGFTERRVATEILGVARSLRDDDAARALEVIEAIVERQRGLLAADQGTPRESGLDANILKLIGEYQASYPWSPPAPSPAQDDFSSRFGRLAPHIERGEVIGFRVNVPPGSVFAEIGLVSGDVITHYDGQRVALDRDPSLVEALQSGAEVRLTVRRQDRTVREVSVPAR
jgi:PDZ domain-containing protein